MRSSTHMVTMDDTVQLATDVYLPDGGSRFPTLLIMTPYGRAGMKVFAELVVPHGYALVAQDVRGRYDSGGTFDPINQEKSDGPSTADWIAAQDWFDAEAGIGIIGISYLATVGFSLAARRDLVKAMLNIGGLPDFYSLTHRGGAMVLHHALPWTIITSRSPQPPLDGIDWTKVYSTLPLGEAAAAAGFDNKLWRSWVSHPARDRYWERLSVWDDLSSLDLPILHMSGWFDLALGCTLELYRYFVQHATTPQHLVIGPWSHNGVLIGPSELQGVDYGPTSRPGVPEHIIAWFDWWLKGDEGPLRQSGLTTPELPVSVFTMHKNQWLRAASWPSGNSKLLDVPITGEGVLAVGSTRVYEPGAYQYVYNPADPVPTIGGATWEFPAAGLDPGPADQTAVCARDDVLLLESEPLHSPLTVAGPVYCELYAQTNAPTTDFTAKLVDLAPGGTSRIVTDGIARIHQVYTGTAGRIAPYTVDMVATAYQFGKNHRLGLELSSSNFPKWDRNTNSVTGELRPARQGIFWGPDHPSRLVLTVIPEEV